MDKLSGYTVLILVGWVTVFGASCGTRTRPAPPAALDSTKLPGASEVMAAIEKKDYDGAMAGLLKIRQTVTTEEQQMQYMVLSREARDKLIEAAASEPKAAEAVEALRAMTRGR